MSGKSVFVTVGTTKFDLLVQTVTQMEVLSALKQRGYDRMVIQIGNGNVLPNEDNAKQCKINLSHFRLKNSLKEDISQADLIISHAGAGTCIEVLEERKALVVVVNEELMNNHQTELAEKLSSEGYLFACTCATLTDIVRTFDINKLKKMSPPQPNIFSDYLEKFMGFQN